MARIIILLGRASSGKTRTIDKLVVSKLGFTRELNWKLYKEYEFIKWAGIAQEIVSNKEVEVFAERSSPQEQHYKSTDIQESINDIKDYANRWVDFLKDKKDAVAIIPFTLRGGSNIGSMILEPLKIFEQSSNIVEIVYLEREYKSNKSLVQNLIQCLIQENKIKHTISSKKEEEDRQAKELLDYLKLKKIQPKPIEEFL